VDYDAVETDAAIKQARTPIAAIGDRDLISIVAR
jgi:hypothetical protein